MLIVGSQALVNWGIRVGRKSQDLDVIAREDEYEDFVKRLKEKGRLRREAPTTSPWKRVVQTSTGRIVEFELGSEVFNPTGLWLLENHDGSEKSHPVWGRSAHPGVVLALKLSHRYLKNSPHFLKTMDDVLALRGLGYEVPPKMVGRWMKAREGWTYDYKHPNLDQGSKTFFSNDGVKYRYEHDDIHQALATLRHRGETQPAYKFFQVDGKEVKVDKEKWDRLPEITKNLSVLEEASVLALERSQIPFDFKVAPRTSFLMALEKVCTSITSGWWREYAWENYYKVLGMYSDDYVQRFKWALDQGRIREYQETPLKEKENGEKLRPASLQP